MLDLLRAPAPRAFLKRRIVVKDPAQMAGVGAAIVFDERCRLGEAGDLGIELRAVEPFPRNVVERPSFHAALPTTRKRAFIKTLTPSRRRRRGASAPNSLTGEKLGERAQFGFGDGLVALETAQLGQEALAIGARGARDLLAQARQISLTVCNSASIAARSSSSGAIASSASTVQRSGVTSAKPPATKTRRVTVRPSINLDRPRPDRRDQQRMARQHAEITLGARHHDHLDRLGEHQALRRHQLELTWSGIGNSVRAGGGVTNRAAPLTPALSPPAGRRRRWRAVGGHQAASAAILRAFSTASSIVPTM